MSMSMGPVWLGVLASLVLAWVVVTHLLHVVADHGRRCAWHTGHMLMGLGMIDMYLPTTRMIVPARAGEVVFTVAAIGVLILIGADVAGKRRVGLLWVLSAVDFVTMTYMFAPTLNTGWLNVLCIGWFVVQAVGWVTGRLGAVVARGGLGEPAPAPAHDSAHVRNIRVTLTIMSVAMAYMFIAMLSGAVMTPDMPGMPGM